MRPWPKTRRRVGSAEDFPPTVRRAFTSLIDSGKQKIWFVQISSGHGWRYLEDAAFRSRSDAKRLAIKTSESHPDREVRTIRWTDPQRRQRQMNAWRSRWSRNKMPAGGSKKGRNVIGEDVTGLIARLLLTPGRTIRQVAKESHVAKQTVNEIAKTLDRPSCPCGREVEHKGWCKFRFENSPKRQEFMKGKGWSQQEVKTPVETVKHPEVAEREAKRALLRAKRDFREAKKRLQEAQENVSKIYRNGALGIIQ